jgi:hypothetical protein
VVVTRAARTAAIASLAVRATFPNTFWDANRSGTTYPDMLWEPKESFRAVADFYADQDRRA